MATFASLVPPSGTENFSVPRRKRLGTTSLAALIGANSLGSDATVAMTTEYSPASAPSPGLSRGPSANRPDSSVVATNGPGPFPRVDVNITVAPPSGLPCKVTVPSTGTELVDPQPAMQARAKQHHCGNREVKLDASIYWPEVSISPPAMLPIAAKTFSSTSNDRYVPDPSHIWMFIPPGWLLNQPALQAR
jgi:hypothetical protein